MDVIEKKLNKNKKKFKGLAVYVFYEITKLGRCQTNARAPWKQTKSPHSSTERPSTQLIVDY